MNVTAGVDYGMEQGTTSTGKWNNWVGASVIAQYKASSKYAVAARAEYFRDDSSVVINTGIPGGFSTYGFSANFDCYITDNVLWRVEGKIFVSETAIYLDGDGNYVAKSPAATTTLCVRF